MILILGYFLFLIGFGFFWIRARKHGGWTAKAERGMTAAHFTVYNNGMWAFWRLTVEGSEMRLRTLFRRKVFSIYDVRRVEANSVRMYGMSLGRTGRIALYSESKKLCTVSAGTAGYRFLLERLKERNIAGVDVLIKEAGMVAQRISIADVKETVQILQTGENPTLLKTTIKPFVTGWLLFISQLVLFFLALVPFLIVLRAEERFLADAYTAIDLLEQALIWNRAMLGSLALGLMLVVIADVLIISFLQRKGHFAKSHVIIMTVMLLLFGGIVSAGLVLEEDTPIMAAQEIQEDIAAIEAGDLGVTTIRMNIALNEPIVNFGPLPGGVVRVVYRQNLSMTPYFVNYPLELSPTAVREMIRGEEFRVPGEPHDRLHDIRAVEVWYTPNLHIVVDVMPIRSNG